MISPISTVTNVVSEHYFSCVCYGEKERVAVEEEEEGGDQERRVVMICLAYASHPPKSSK